MFCIRSLIPQKSRIQTLLSITILVAILGTLCFPTRGMAIQGIDPVIELSTKNAEACSDDENASCISELFTVDSSHTASYEFDCNGTPVDIPWFKIFAALLGIEIPPYIPDPTPETAICSLLAQGSTFTVYESGNPVPLVKDTYIGLKHEGHFAVQPNHVYELKLNGHGRDFREIAQANGLTFDSYAKVTYQEVDPPDESCQKPFLIDELPYSGNLEYSGDHDCQRVHLPGENQFLVLDVPDGKNYQLEVWADDMMQFKSSANDAGMDERIFISKPGYYRIHVFGVDPLSDFNSPYRVLLTSAPTQENAIMVKDISSGDVSSNPAQLTEVNGGLFFVVDNYLWKSDGTEAGTFKLIDATGAGGQPSFVYPHDLIELNGKLYFAARSISYPPSEALWMTDGTPNGTMKILELVGSTISQLTAVGENLYYVIDDCGPGSSRCAILARTNPVCAEIGSSGQEDCDLRFGRDIVGSDPNLSNLTNVNGTLFFVHGEYYSTSAAGSVQFHWQLWKAGHVLPTESTVIGDIPGDVNNPPREFTVMNDLLYFIANDGVNGWKLWKSNGTTIQMVPAVPGQIPQLGSSYSNPEELTEVGSDLYFVAGNVGLWMVDHTGSAAGIYCHFTGTSCHTNLSQLTNVNGTLYFVESWELATTLLRHNSNGISSVKVFPVERYFFPRLSHLTEVNGTLFFSADDGVNGAELWKSDGTEESTILVADIAPGSASSDPQELTSVNETLFFAANDGIHGNELWRTVVENIPPSSENTLAGTQGTNGWYRSNVKVTLSAIDNFGGSGVQKIEYGFNFTPWEPFSGPWNVYVDPFEVSEEGHTYLVYRSIDNAGNVESNQTQLIMIDKTPPSILPHPIPSPNSNGWYNADVQVSFEASDFQSGIASLTPMNYTFTSEGIDQSVTGTAVDNAGNSATFTIGNINIDKTPPVITMITPQARDYLHSEAYDIAWSASDSLSGIETSLATLDGQPVSNGQTIDLFFLSLGQHSVALEAMDHAGNCAGISVSFNVTADITSLRAVTQRTYDLGWIEKQGAYNALDAKLRAAQQNIERNQLDHARKQLFLFIEKLDSQKGKAINQQAYDLLKTDALYVLEHLQ